MRVTLAGFNLDAEIIAQLRLLLDIHRQGGESSSLTELLDRLAEEPLTPETLSAAYARISRSDKKVGELRRDARSSVSRSRQSNEKIVFGLGHASVAEHAVFNLDITDASRLAFEELESHRLASFTESSQRYISMTGDYIVPAEITASGLEDEYRRLCERLFESYRMLSVRLEEFHTALPEKERQGRAREDARYLLPLSCRGQAGMTLNARNAEWIIQQSTHSALAEVREMGTQIARLLRSLTPSLIKYTEPTPRWQECNEDIHKAFQQNSNPSIEDCDDVKLLNQPIEGERIVYSALGLRVAGKSFKDIEEIVRRKDHQEIHRVIVEAHRYLTPHSPVRRELELASFTFGIILSASAFAQLKRHRLATIIPQPYDPSLDITIPPAVMEAGLEETFRSYIDEAAKVYDLLQTRLSGLNKTAAQYALTNAHRRRIIFHANARELIHLSRLRLDSHAQWDIRQIAGEMITLAREACPTLMYFAAGKDEFDRVTASIEGNS